MHMYSGVHMEEMVKCEGEKKTELVTFLRDICLVGSLYFTQCWQGKK